MYPVDLHGHHQQQEHHHQPHPSSSYAYGGGSSSSRGGGGSSSGILVAGATTEEYMEVMGGGPLGLAATQATVPLEYRHHHVGPGTVIDELDNFTTLNSLRHHHSTDPYFDTKLMKQKLLSVNVPESCV